MRTSWIRRWVPQVSPSRHGIVHAKAGRANWRSLTSRKPQVNGATRSNSHAHSKAQMEFVKTRVRRHLRGGSQVSKARPGAPIVLSRRFSHRLFRAGLTFGRPALRALMLHSVAGSILPRQERIMPHIAKVERAIWTVLGSGGRNGKVPVGTTKRNNFQSSLRDLSGFSNPTPGLASWATFNRPYGTGPRDPG